MEDVEDTSEKQLQEEKDHYLRVVTRGGAASAVDFRGNAEEAETYATLLIDASAHAMLRLPVPCGKQAVCLHART